METEKKLQRTFGFLDSNKSIPWRSARVTRRSSTEAAGQENTAKRAKLSEEAVKSEEVKFGALPKLLQVKEECVPVKEEPVICDRKDDGEYIIINDVNNQWKLTSEHIEDVYHAEIELERRVKLSEEYCSDSCVIDPVRREVLLEWLLQLQCSARVGSEVFHLAVTLMDVYFDCVVMEDCDVRSAATSAFWLSYKYYYGRVEVKSILKHCRVSKTDLLRYERLIFQHVDFNLQFPNSMSLIHYHMYRMFDGVIPRVLYYCVCYLLDLMFYHIEFVHETYHSRALTGLFTTLYLFKSPVKTKLWSDFDRKVKETVQIIHNKLLILLKKVRMNDDFRKESVLYRRYSSSKFRRICKHSALNRDLGA